RQSRVAGWRSAVAFGCAALGGYYDAFWPLACFSIIAIWAFIAGLRVLDSNWRMRCGLVTSITLLAGVSLWPSLESMTNGRVPCPAYVKDRVKFRLVAGLD